MEGERAVLDAHCQEIAERVLPRQRDFGQSRREGLYSQGGGKVGEKVFDSTAPLALERFAAAIEQMITPRTQRWHELSSGPRDGGDPSTDDAELKRYLYDATTTLFRARYAPQANFASQAHETYTSLGAFGNGAIFVDDMIGRGLRYRSIPFAELYFAENFQGMVDTVHRRFEMTARQWMQRFGDETPEAIQRAAETEPHRRFELVHCVQPREDADWSRMDYRGMTYASYYVSFEGRKVMAEGGYRAFRYAVARYVTAPREVYGRGPAMTVLADIKGVNEQQKTLLRTGQMIADPPLLLSEEGALSGFKLKPGGLNYGAIGFGGEELVKPLQIGANLPITLEMINQTRGVINDAFLVSLFQILVDTPQMTATEAMLRAQEKGALLAPTMGRLQSELLGPMIQAEIDILAQAGVIPPPPDSAGDAQGLTTHIEYTSPLARAQKADEGVAILRSLEDAAALAQYDPTTPKMIKGPEALRRLWEIRGAPPNLLRSAKEMEEIAAAEAQAQQLQQLLQGAQAAGGAAKNFAAAGVNVPAALAGGEGAQ